MYVTLLVTNDILPIPSDINIIQNWGLVQVVLTENEGEVVGFIAGDHMHLEGEEKSVLDWFVEKREVWLQSKGTSPMQLEFEKYEFTQEGINA